MREDLLEETEVSISQKNLKLEQIYTEVDGEMVIKSTVKGCKTWQLRTRPNSSQAWNVESQSCWNGGSERRQFKSRSVKMKRWKSLMRLAGRRNSVTGFTTVGQAVKHVGLCRGLDLLKVVDIGQRPVIAVLTSVSADGPVFVDRSSGQMRRRPPFSLSLAQLTLGPQSTFSHTLWYGQYYSDRTNKKSFDFSLEIRIYFGVR